MSEFTIYQDGIFRKLREGHGTCPSDEFFYSAIKEQAKLLAARCNATVELNPVRVAEAQDLWERDMLALINDKKIQESPYPCEYKHAAFLCFWLRRRLIIESTRPIDPKKGIVDRDFHEYKNEYVAFYTAVHLVLFHYFRFDEDATSEEVAQALKDYQFPKSLTHEVLVMLHHKNVSPHSLYLIFKSLVTPLPPPRRAGGPILLSI